MILREQNILLFSRSIQYGGTEKVMEQICRFLVPCVNKVIVCGGDGFTAEGVHKLGAEYYPIPDIENKSIRIFVSVLSTLVRIVRTENITLIHTHHRMAAFYTAILKRRYNFYFVNTAHNTFSNRRILTRFSYKRANLVACGEMVKKNLVEQFGISDNKITVIYNAVEPFDGKKIDIPEITNAKKEEKVVIGNIGRLTEQKGVVYFIQAAELVLRECPNAYFLIIGDGEKRTELEEKVSELGISDWVCFLGYRTDVQNVMSQLNFIVLSSLWEGLPLTPIEAFSVGVPVIGTAVDGTPEVITNGLDGILVKAKDVNELADAMVKLINNEKLRNKYKHNAKNTYDKKFSIKRLEKEYQNFYERL